LTHAPGRFAEALLGFALPGGIVTHTPGKGKILAQVMCIQLEAAAISPCPPRVHNGSRWPTLGSGTQKLVFSEGVCAQAMLEVHHRARAYCPRPGSGMQKLVFCGGKNRHHHAKSNNLTFECH